MLTITALIIGICLIIQGHKRKDAADVTDGTIMTIVCGSVLIALAIAALMMVK